MARWLLGCAPNIPGVDALEGAAHRRAEHDLEAIHDYIAELDSATSADYMLDQLLETAETLATFPERGSHPRELLALGIRDYRQIYFKPYRVIYRIIEQHVYVYLIVDGRRDMQWVLARRLLGA